MSGWQISGRSENILMQNIHDSIDDKGYGNESDLESLSSLAVNEDLEFENFSEDGLRYLMKV